MEDNNYSLDSNAIIKELQTLNEGTSSNGEKLDQVIEYLLIKEEKETKEKKATEEEEEVKKEEEQKAIQEKEENETQQNETYTELLTDIRDQTVLANNLISGQIFFMGVIFGIIFLNVLWNRFIR